MEHAQLQNYMRPLDGIRGMACLLVVLTHIGSPFGIVTDSSWVYMGGFGVVLFFVLSGFLMSRLYVQKPFTVYDGAKYAIARFTRIAPAYWIAVIFVTLVYIVVPDFHYQMSLVNIVRSVLFVGNQGVFWSIPPEVQFYGFFLLLWFACWAYRSGRKIWVLPVAALCVLFIVTRQMWGGLMLPSTLHIFLCGFAAGFLPDIPAVKGFIYKTGVQILLTAILVVYLALYITEKNLFSDLVLPLIAGLWIVSMSASTFVTVPFETRTMTLMGAASFSIYVFHHAIVHAMIALGWIIPDAWAINVAIMSFVCIAIPVAFHFKVEKPLHLWSKEKLTDCLMSTRTGTIKKPAEDATSV